MAFEPYQALPAKALCFGIASPSLMSRDEIFTYMCQQQNKRVG
jgi:hypothetical protein